MFQVRRLLLFSTISFPLHRVLQPEAHGSVNTPRRTAVHSQHGGQRGLRGHTARLGSQRAASITTANSQQCPPRTLTDTDAERRTCRAERKRCQAPCAATGTRAEAKLTQKREETRHPGITKWCCNPLPRSVNTRIHLSEKTAFFYNSVIAKV